MVLEQVLRVYKDIEKGKIMVEGYDRNGRLDKRAFVGALSPIISDCKEGILS